MEKLVFKGQKEANNLYYFLYGMFEDHQVGEGRAKDFAFRPRGSLHHACFGLYKYIYNLKTEAEKRYWKETLKDASFIEDIILNAKEESMDHEDFGKKNFDFIKANCIDNAWPVNNFLVNMILTYENAERPYDEKKLN